jgi:hypothetical protein
MQSPALAGLVLALLVQAPLAGQYPPTTPSQAPAPSPVKLSGYIQAREVYQSEIGLTSSINRARLSASGGIVEAVTWRIQGEFRTGSVGTGRASVSLQDAYIRYNPGTWAVQAGQFKTPFTREFITSLADIETADRATVVDSIAPKRDIGLMGEYTYRRFSLWVGVFNGEGQNVTANTDSTVLGVARLAVRLLPQLSFAVNGARYFGDSTRYGVDAAYEDARFAVKGEYLGQTRDEASGSDDWGWYGLGAVYVISTVQAVAKYEEFGRPAVTTSVKSRAWTAGLKRLPQRQEFPADLRLSLSQDRRAWRAERPASGAGRSKILRHRSSARCVCVA